MRTKLVTRFASAFVLGVFLTALAACSGESPTDVEPTAAGGNCYLVNGQIVCMEG